MSSYRQVRMQKDVHLWQVSSTDRTGFLLLIYRDHLPRSPFAFTLASPPYFDLLLSPRDPPCNQTTQSPSRPSMNG